MAETAEQKDLRIKTGVCKRTLKDLEYYHTEISEHKVKITGMEEEGKDANDIDKRREMLTETENMVPDSRRRLRDAMDDLEASIGGMPASEEEKEDPGLTVANEMLTRAKTHFDERDEDDGSSGGEY